MSDHQLCAQSRLESQAIKVKLNQDAALRSSPRSANVPSYNMSTNSTQAFTRLIRFEDEEGVVQWGDLTGDSGVENISGTKVNVLEGGLESGFTRTNVTKKIGKVSQGCVLTGLLTSERRLTQIILFHSY